MKDDICSNKHQDNPCSIDAHKAVESSKEILKRQIVTYVTEARGATTEEISRAIGIRYTTASARCSELKRSGVLVESGRKRLTSSGVPAAVLILGET